MTGMVIVNYNDFKTTKILLNNIKNYKSLNHIVVVDNASTDHSYDELKKLENKRIHILKNDKNLGYSDGLNLGCQFLIEKYQVEKIAISNSDIEIQSDEDLNDLFSYLNENVVVVGPTIITGNEISRGWKVPTYLDDLMSNIPYFHTLFFNKRQMYNKEYYHKATSQVETVSGCFFVISSKFLKEINYFDSNVFLYYEENILGKKIKNHNKICLVCNEIDVIHHHSVTIDKALNKIKKYDVQKKSQLYYEKNYNKINKIQECLLKIVIKITRCILNIKYKIDDLRNIK